MKGSYTIKENARLKKLRNMNTEEEYRKKAPAAREQKDAAQQKTKETIAKEFFHCSSCGHHILADREAFDLSNLGGKTRCKSCNKSWEAKLWKCTCKILWHKFETNKDSPQIMREARESSKSKPGAKVKQAAERGKRSLDDADEKTKKKEDKSQGHKATLL